MSLSLPPSFLNPGARPKPYSPPLWGTRDLAILLLPLGLPSLCLPLHCAECTPLRASVDVDWGLFS